MADCEDDYSRYFPLVRFYYVGLLGQGMQIELVSSDDKVKPELWQLVSSYLFNVQKHISGSEHH